MEPTTLRRLRAHPDATSKERFLAKFARPFLIVERLAATAAPSGPKTNQNPTRYKQNLYKEREVWELSRRDGSNKPVITVGRTPETDVYLSDQAVSKVHVTLQRDASGAYTVTDSGSANGSRLNGVKLVKNVPLPIKDLDELHIGLVYSCIFMAPETLFNLIQEPLDR